MPSRRPLTYVSDLRHFLDDDGAIVAGLPGRMGAYVALIVEVGSVVPVETAVLAPAMCANPSRRRRCGGRLVIGRSTPDDIVWECDTCGENGVVTHWAGTRFDLSGVAGERAPASVDVVARADELWALRRSGGGTPALRRVLAAPMDIGDHYLSLGADSDALSTLLELCEEAAAATRGEERRALDRLAGRLDAFRTSHPDFFEPEEIPLDLAALEEAGHPPELIALARTIAAAHGRDAVLLEDMVEADRAWKQGRRPVLN